MYLGLGKALNAKKAGSEMGQPFFVCQEGVGSFWKPVEKAKPYLHFFVIRNNIVRRVCHCGDVTRIVPCDKCKSRNKPKWSKRKDDYDSKWRVLSERFRANNPLCKDCQEKDIVEPATEVHHIVPIAEDRSRRLDVKNLVALCNSCHRERHRRMRLG